MLANKGYLALGKETTKGVAVTPNVFVPYYNEDLFTQMNFHHDNPIMGHKLERFKVLPGIRSHRGSITTMAEPNTAGFLLDMILTRVHTTVSGPPLVHTFALDNTKDPNSYTIDIQKGNIVARFAGVEASELGVDFDENKMVFNLSVSALKSFIVSEVRHVVREVDVSFITLWDSGDGSTLTDSLLAGDVMVGTNPDGSSINFTINSVLDGNRISTLTDVTILGQGSIISLRPVVPSFNLLKPFLWSKTEFRIGDSVAESDPQTRVETGSRWTLRHNFEEEDGARRSGGQDPATLLRTTGDLEVDIKRVFDNAFSANNWLNRIMDTGLLIKHISDDHSVGPFSLDVWVPNGRLTEHPVTTESGSIVYAETKLFPEVPTHTADRPFQLSLRNLVQTI